MNTVEWMKTDEALDLHLGQMVRLASNLEYFLEQVAKELCDSPYSALLVSGENATRVLDIVRVLITAREDATDEWRKKVQAVLADAKTAFERRNQYVHGSISWRGEGAATPGTSRSRRLKPEPDFVPLELAELASLSKEFRRLCFATGACLAAVQQGFPDHLDEEYSEE